MKKFLSILLSFVFLIAATSVQSQSTDHKRKYGFGLTLSEVSKLNTTIDSRLPTQTILIPIRLTNKIRIEPEIGFLQFKRESSDENSKSQLTERIKQLGVGICQLTSQNSFEFYYGARFGYISYSSKDEYVSGNFIDRDEESGSGFYISPVLGGEYYFSKHFSVGGEVQLKYSDLDFEEGIGTDKEETSLSRISTSGIICIRIYF